MSEPADSVLAANDLRISYGELTVVDGVSLPLPTGTLTALVGPNGSGKTTLLRALAGVVRPSSGSVEYAGPEAPRPIGYLPQRPAFRPGFSVEETLAHYAALVGEGEVESRLERVGLASANERRVEALSGGMTRLLGIAQATVGNPPVVLLDEPASGLDPSMRVRVFEVAADLASRGAAVAVSSHDLELVERHAEGVSVLERGSIVATGSPESIVSRAGADSLLEAFESVVEREPGHVGVVGGTR